MTSKERFLWCVIGYWLEVLLETGEKRVIFLTKI